MVLSDDLTLLCTFSGCLQLYINSHSIVAMQCDIFHTNDLVK